MGRVEGKVAVITGAARGMGREHAVQLAREGADIVAIDICGYAGNDAAPDATPEDLAETVRLVEAEGGRILARQGDVRDGGRLQEIVDEALTEFGHIDVVVGNAAISRFAPVWEITEEDWQAHIDVNLTGNFKLLKAVMPSMMEAGRGGSLILIGSTSGNRGIPLNAHYVAAKHGLVGLMRALAVELGPFGIRANSLHPGHTETPMGVGNWEAMAPLIERFPQYLARFGTTLPVDGLIQPVDLSHAVVYLASDESRYLTGIVIPVDAGLSL